MSQEDVLRCPICESSSFSLLHKSKDYTVTGELFHIKQCKTCALLITSPRPTAETLSRYYQSVKYISHSSAGSGPFGSIYFLIRYFTLKWKFALIKPYLHGGSLLDYGCGTGNFLKEAIQNNCAVQGVEPSTEARKKISSPIPVVSSLHELPSIQFDVITLWHVLEHVSALSETLRHLNHRLGNRGTIFIAVPNWESYDAAHYHHQWAGYDVPRHLWHFSKNSMEALIQKEGLRIIKVIPMKLDAYYVSMLSEKNANGGRLSIIRTLGAIWVAFVSNLRGREKKNQSSLIFVVQK